MEAGGWPKGRAGSSACTRAICGSGFPSCLLVEWLLCDAGKIRREVPSNACIFRDVFEGKASTEAGEDGSKGAGR